MSAGTRSNSDWLVRAVLVLWLISGAFVLFLIVRVDSIVNGTLYSYGLQFDFAWADPYWTALGALYVFLSAPMVLSVVALVSGFRRRGDRGKPAAIAPAAKSKPGAVVVSKDDHMLVSCPTCKKVFSRPLVMLDFGGGRTKLVNVCPYCNHVLGKAHAGDKDKDDVRVRGPQDLQEEEVEEK